MIQRYIHLAPGHLEEAVNRKRTGEFIMTNETENKALATFEGKKVRKTWHNDRWYFVIVDIVVALTDTTNPHDYL